MTDLYLQLTVIYLHGGSITSRGWNIAGIGLRLAQDIGAHRKKVYGDAPTAEDELFKRAFWSVPAVNMMSSDPPNVALQVAYLDGPLDERTTRPYMCSVRRRVSKPSATCVLFNGNKPLWQF